MIILKTIFFKLQLKIYHRQYDKYSKRLKLLKSRSLFLNMSQYDLIEYENICESIEIKKNFYHDHIIRCNSKIERLQSLI